MSAAPGISEYVQKDYFRHAYGTSPAQHLLALRMPRAQELLEAGNQVAETTNRVSYPHPINLSAAVTRCFGRTLKSILGDRSCRALPVPPNVPAMTEPHAAPASAADRREIFLNLNESPFGLFDEAEAAAAHALADAGRYQFPLVERLRDAIAAMHGVPADWVSLYPGSNRALHYATLAFTAHDAPLVLASPGYPVCEQAARLASRPVHHVPLRADGAHDVAAMCEAAPRGLMYVANPNNPTGTVTPHDALRRLLSGRTPGATVLVDEAYIEYSDEPSMLDAVPTHPGLIVARTFSKIYGMAGLRLGYAVAQPDTIARIHSMPPHDVPAPAAAAALASLALRDRLGERKAYTAAGRDDLIRWLSTRGLACMPSRANCVMVDLGRAGLPVIAALAARGVHVGRSWPDMPNWMRITIGARDEMTALKEALAHVLAESPARDAA
ncbi:aminotransferase class I/II-fold pyridoxal phosphate-dependent enzyme [Burkholderia stabilis]|uniref:aminotransferase class I/II-fold pyridoxal phosphate-dependent enzyme n=1 Tax=Burkholderia stabilis TaxID=95485 RepID=UPI00158E01B7|nr:aminotransferase class I/II-fold pyridoxal phosphate-dependent enzyme [Burkholderia stabilis]